MNSFRLLSLKCYISIFLRLYRLMMQRAAKTNSGMFLMAPIKLNTYKFCFIIRSTSINGIIQLYVLSQNSHAAWTVSNSNVLSVLQHNNLIIKPYRTSVTSILLRNCMLTFFAIFSLAQCRLLGQHSVVKSYSFHRATDFP